MINKFSVRNFRNVNVKDIEFNKINILIGPNNSGKTNFIKALTFFANMIIHGKDNSFDSSFLGEVERNGWDKILNKDVIGYELPGHVIIGNLEQMLNRDGPSSNEIEFNWNISLDNEVCNYTFAFNVGYQPQYFYITKEELSVDRADTEDKIPYNYFKCHTTAKGMCEFSVAGQKGQQNKRIDMPVSEKDTVLFQFKEMLFEKPEIDNEKIIRNQFSPKFEQLQKYFKGFLSYSSAQFNLNAIRQPAEIRTKGLFLQKDGGNFVNVLNYYKSKDIYFKKHFEEKLKELMPFLTMTDISTEFDKMVFRLGYDHKQFDLYDLSEGTIKALLLTLLIFLPVKDSYSLLALDEPEMNLHPAWQKVIGRWIQTVEGDRQYFISTHSPDFLDVFTEGFKNGNVGIFVFDSKKEEQITRLSYEKIYNELEGWELGDLYRTSEPAIGGWPW
jgi:predicted ATPase